MRNFLLGCSLLCLPQALYPQAVTSNNPLEVLYPFQGKYYEADTDYNNEAIVLLEKEQLTIAFAYDKPDTVKYHVKAFEALTSSSEPVLDARSTRGYPVQVRFRADAQSYCSSHQIQIALLSPNDSKVIIELRFVRYSTFDEKIGIFSYRDYETSEILTIDFNSAPVAISYQSTEKAAPIRLDVEPLPDNPAKVWVIFPKSGTRHLVTLKGYYVWVKNPDGSSQGFQCWNR